MTAAAKPTSRDLELLAQLAAAHGDISKQISRKIARPTRLQKLTSTGWQSSSRRSASRSGRVAYTFSAPATTTRYRVIAPAHRVKLTRKAPGRKATTKVVLRAWACARSSALRAWPWTT